MIAGIRRFRLPPSRDTLERDIAEEIAFHIESRTAELVAGGMMAHQAREQAEREFGDVAAARTELGELGAVRLRALRRADLWDATWYELRQAARGLARAPGFTAALVVTLALGIGVNAAMFGLADRLLLSAPPHVQGADRLVRVVVEHTPSWDPVLQTFAEVSYADYVSLRERTGAFEAVAAYGSPAVSALGRGAAADEARIAQVTSEFFHVLGVSPVRGRFLSAQDDSDGADARVVVLGYGIWQRRFGGSEDVIGQDIEINHRPFTIIGVAPRGFTGVDLAPVDAWVPVAAMAPLMLPEWRTRRDAMAWLRPVARLAPHATREAAAAEAGAVFFAAEEIRQRHEGDATARIVLTDVNAARTPGTGAWALAAQRSGRVALWLFGVSAVVLLIACANVANLLLARALRARREIGVRLALGVSRARLAGQVLAGTAIIAALAALLGVVLAQWGGRIGRGLLLPDYEWAGSHSDGRVLLFATVATLASAILAGLLPALHAARSDVVALLGGGRAATYARSRSRAALVALQAALSLVLLVGAGLFVRSLHNAQALALGYDANRVATLQWHSSGLEWTRQRVFEVYDRSLERAQALPGVESAALSMYSPMWGSIGSEISVPGRDSVPLPPGMFGFMYDAVSPGWFRTMGTRLVHGRTFTDADAQGSAPVVVVTASLAQWLWPGEPALGKCLVQRFPAYQPACREVVGVVEDLRYRSIESADMMYFVPLAQGPPFPVRTLSVRTRDEPARALAGVVPALHAMEPGLPYLRATPLQERVAPQLRPWRLGAVAFAAFGVLALLLAALGLYGVVAFDVVQRTRELGVRAALGAGFGDNARLVVAGALRMVVPGLLAGVVLAFWLAPRLDGLLFDVPARDWRVFALAAGALLAVALAAAALPGRRGARVQPLEALRDD